MLLNGESRYVLPQILYVGANVPLSGSRRAWPCPGKLKARVVPDGHIVLPTAKGMHRTHLETHHRVGRFNFIQTWSVSMDQETRHEIVVLSLGTLAVIPFVTGIGLAIVAGVLAW